MCIKKWIKENRRLSIGAKRVWNISQRQEQK